MSTESRQLAALTFCAATVPSILILPRAGWLWAGLAAFGAGGLFLLARPLGTLGPEPGKAAKILLIPLLLWNLLALGSASGVLCGAFPGAGSLIGLLLLLLVAYAAGNGLHIVLRTGSVIFFLLLLIYGTLMAFSLPDLELSRLAPALRADWRLLPSALAPMLTLLLPGDKKGRGWALWLGGSGLLALLAALVTAGMGAEDFYTASESVSVLSAMERLEPLVSAALTMGGFCLLGLICSVNEKIFVLSGVRKYGGLLNFLLSAALFLPAGKLPSSLLATGTAIFWGFWPILLLSVENSKKLKKFSKNP